MKQINTLLILLISTFITAQSAFAISLDEAKEKGLVGETTTGYIAAVENSSEVSALVADINSRRKAKYESIAKQNKASLSSVEKLAAQKAISKTPAGQYVKDSTGQWKRK